MSSGNSPISSRKSVPPSAWTMRPGELESAPVNAPFTYPNNSASSRVLAMAPQSTVTNGRFWRALN